MLVFLLLSAMLIVRDEFFVGIYLLFVSEFHPARQLQESVLNLPDQNPKTKERLLREQVRKPFIVRAASNCW